MSEPRITVDPSRLVVADFDAKEQGVLDRLWKQLRDRLERNRERGIRYEMKNVIDKIANVVPPQYYHAYGALGWNTKAVDALVRRCNFENVSWTGDLGSAGAPDLLGEEDTSPPDALEPLGYDDFRDENRLRASIRSASVGSLVHGVGFLINDVQMAPGEDVSSISWGSAVDTTGFWDYRGRELEFALSINEWRNESLPLTFTLYTPGSYLIVQWEERSAAYRTIAEWTHPFGMPVEPLVYKPFLRPFGSSRITPPMMSLQDRGVAALIRMEAHMDIYAIPDFWILGAAETLFGGNTQAWKVMMGRLKAIPDDDNLIDLGSDAARLARADVKQFPAASPDPHLAAINAIAKLYAREADLPDSAVAITDVSNPTSADSYIESRESIISEAEGATDDWSIPIRRSIARGLAIQNGDPGLIKDLRDMEVNWRPHAYLSSAAHADAGAKQLAAAPDWLKQTSVGLQLLGLTPQQIRQAYRERKTLPTPPPPPQIVVQSAPTPTAPEPNGAGTSSETESEE